MKFKILDKEKAKANPATPKRGPRNKKENIGHHHYQSDIKRNTRIMSRIKTRVKSGIVA